MEIAPVFYYLFENYESIKHELNKLSLEDLAKVFYQVNNYIPLPANKQPSITKKLIPKKELRTLEHGDIVDYLIREHGLIGIISYEQTHNNLYKMAMENYKDIFVIEDINSAALHDKLDIVQHLAKKITEEWEINKLFLGVSIKEHPETFKFLVKVIKDLMNKSTSNILCVPCAKDIDTAKYLINESICLDSSCLPLAIFAGDEEYAMFLHKCLTQWDLSELEKVKSLVDNKKVRYVDQSMQLIKYFQSHGYLFSEEEFIRVLRGSNPLDSVKNLITKKMCLTTRLIELYIIYHKDVKIFSLIGECFGVDSASRAIDNARRCLYENIRDEENVKCVVSKLKYLNPECLSNIIFAKNHVFLKHILNSRDLLATIHPKCFDIYDTDAYMSAAFDIGHLPLVKVLVKNKMKISNHSLNLLLKINSDNIIKYLINKGIIEIINPLDGLDIDKLPCIARILKDYGFVVNYSNYDPNYNFSKYIVTSKIEDMIVKPGYIIKYQGNADDIQKLNNY